MSEKKTSIFIDKPPGQGGKEKSMSLITMQQAEAIIKKNGLHVFAQYRMNNELKEHMFHVQVCGITREDMVESITATLEEGIRYAVQQYTGGAV